MLDKDLVNENHFGSTVTDWWIDGAKKRLFKRLSSPVSMLN